MGVTKLTYFFLVAVLYLSDAVAQDTDTYGLLLSGGSNLESNHYRYFDNTKKMHNALRERGVKRSKILTLYSDGGAKGNDTIEKGFFWDSHIDTPKSLEDDSVNDIRYGANKRDISRSFDVLAANMKSGDHLVLFITDHGSKNSGVVLWNGEYYDVDDLKKQLGKLPNGVTTHLMTNICYGGQLLELTGPNTCVMANSNSNIVTYSNTNDDPFASNFAYALKKNKRDGNSNGKSNMFEAFSYARDNDLSSNKVHLTSLDHFLEKEDRFISLERASDHDLVQCRESTSISPLSKLTKEIDLAIQFINSKGSVRRQALKKGVEKQINELKDDLDSWRIGWAESAIKKLEIKYTSLKKEYDGLSGSDKNRLRPKYTALAEDLRSEISHQKRLVDNVKQDYERALRELRFLKYASNEKFQEYLSIKRCLEYEI